MGWEYTDNVAVCLYLGRGKLRRGQSVLGEEMGLRFVALDAFCSSGERSKAPPVRERISQFGMHWMLSFPQSSCMSYRHFLGFLVRKRSHFFVALLLSFLYKLPVVFVIAKNISALLDQTGDYWKLPSFERGPLWVHVSQYQLFS